MPLIYSTTASYVTEIILNDPQNGNRLNYEFLQEFLALLNKAVASENTRVIVIRGTDGIFSLGMDFRFILNQGGEISQELTRPYADVMLAVRNSPKPVIALIEGQAIAGGMGFVLASDIVIATENAGFALTEVLFGIIPAYVFPLLLERMPLKKARFFVMSSKTLNAEEAKNIGIVDDVTSSEKAAKTLKNYYQRLLYSKPEAMALVKSYTDTLTDSKIRENMQYAGKTLAELLQDRETRDAIRDFLQGIKMHWARTYKKRKP